jgi:predicted nucleotidyltransferase
LGKAVPVFTSLDRRIIESFPAGFDLDRHCVCAAYMGSISHNTYVPKEDPDSIDDVDIMGVVVPPPERVIGLRKWEHWTLQKDELDVVFFSLQKFVELLLKSNPNVVGLLWLRPDLYLRVHPAFQKLIDHRDIFGSRQAYESFAGYASAQIKKMEGGAFEGYMGARRKALVEKHGYDAKMAAHAIRLLRMGAEFLETGKLQVFREEDAEELRAIKRGEWSLDRVKQEAEKGFERAKAARENSPLPEKPDFARADELLVGITLEIWKETGAI